MHPLIESHRAQLRELAARHGVTDVRVFGSMARGDATEASDVDLLVRPRPGTSLLDLGGLLMEAQALLGRRVEVVSERALHPLLRDRILKEAAATVKPSTQSDLMLLGHILDCVAKIREYPGLDLATFFGTPIVQDAVLRNLQVMAESSQRLSDEIRATEASIPWSQVAGMRNILVHQYLGGIDLDTVWAVVENDLGSLEAALRRMHDRLERP
jgi:uncharacterized protein with HEPN domain/predicted nucleotidyltransferase